MLNLFLAELVIPYKKETLSARIDRLDSLEYNRYSIFFNQQIADIGPSHMLISKRVAEGEYHWVCEDNSFVQDEELARLVGNEIDKFLTNTDFFNPGNSPR